MVVAAYSKACWEGSTVVERRSSRSFGSPAHSCSSCSSYSSVAMRASAQELAVLQDYDVQG